MRIDEVRASAFGPYQDEILTLSPGMNIFHGPNETGKSSWFAALYAGLAGQRKPRTNATVQSDFASRHRPWSGSQWAAGVLVTMDDGAQLSFSHDLRSGESEITDASAGRDLSIDELEARFGIQLTTEAVLDGTRLLGLNRHSARATTFIGQADVLRVLSDADELHEAMERAAASETSGFDAEAALSWLQARRKELQDAPALERTLNEASTVTAKALSQLEQLNDVIAKERAVSREKVLAARDLELVRSVDRWAEINLLKPRLAAAQLLQSKIDDKGAPNGGAADDEQIRNAMVVLGAYDRLGDPPPAPIGVGAEDLAAEIAELPEPPVGDLTPSAAVISAHAALIAAQQRVDEHAAAAPTAPDVLPDAPTVQELRGGNTKRTSDEAELDQAWVRYHETVERNVAARKTYKAALKQHAKADKAYRADLAAFRRGDDQTTSSSEWKLPAIFGVVLILEILIFALVSNVLGLIVGVLGIFGLLTVRHSANHETRRMKDDDPTVLVEGAGVDAARGPGVAGAPTSPGPPPVEPDYEPEIQPDENEAHVLAAGTLIAQRDAAAFRLAGALQHDVTPPLDRTQVASVVKAYEAYVLSCEERAEIGEKAARRTELERELGTLRQSDADHRAAIDQRRAVVDELISVAVQVTAWEPAESKESTSTADAAEHVRLWIEAQEQARTTTGARAELSARLDQLLDGNSITSLAEKIASLEAAAVDEPPTVPPDMESFRKQAGERHDQVIEQLGDFRGQRAGLGQGLLAPAELIETEQEIQRHTARTRDFQSLLNATESELRLARDRARANIAPAVEERIRPWLPRVTQGRYVDATVSPEELTINVTDRDGQVRAADLLSQGTTEQVFLLLRVALAQVLGGGVEESAPIVLDDVTVQSDQGRTFAILELLHELSADHQVVLFTQELEVIDWAREHLDRSTDQVMALTPASDLGTSQRTLF